MGQRHALGRSGRARRVDQRQRILEADFGSDRKRVEVRVELHQLLVAHRAALASDHDHVLEVRQVVPHLFESRQEIRFDDDDLGGRVLEHVLDLLGGGRLVDRKRHGAEGHRGEVGRDEIRAVVGQQAHRVAAGETERVESTRQSPDPLRKVVPRVADALVLRDHGRRVALPGRGLQESFVQVLGIRLVARTPGKFCDRLGRRHPSSFVHPSRLATAG